MSGVQEQPVLLAARTRKARRRGGCTLCPGPVITGQRIGLIPGGWAHVACIVRRNSTGTGKTA